MKIIIDNSNLNVGGGVQVALSFLSDLIQLNLNNQYVIIQSPNVAKQTDIEQFPGNFRFIILDEKRHNNLIKRIRDVKEIENQINPDCIFTVFGPSYHKSNFPKVVGFALGQILYPNSPFYKNINFNLYLKIKLVSKLKSYFFQKNSDVLIYETDDANKRYSKIVNGEIIGYTVSNTVNKIFYDVNNWDEINIEKSKFDILYLTANYPHKNLSIIPKVIDSIIDSNRLFDFKFHLSVTKDEMKFGDKYDNYINYLGKINIKQIPLLYKKMDLLFMPTLLETFSTTYLEAMVSKIPIVTSDLSFARDICGEAALYSDPLDPKDYASNVISLYDNKDLYNDLVIKGKSNLERFGTSMDRTKKYIEIIEKHKKCK